MQGGNVMAGTTLMIKYDSDEIRRTAKNAASSFGLAARHLNGVINGLDGQPEQSSRNYLSHANAFLRKKVQQYENKQEALETFSSKVTDYVSDAREADKRVANFIEDRGNEFKQITGLKEGILPALLDVLDSAVKLWKYITYTLPKSLIEGVKDILVDTVEGIKRWYNEDGKYFFKAIWDTVKVIGTICAIGTAFFVSGGTLAVIWAGFTIAGGLLALTPQIADAVNSAAALTFYLTGDKDTAEMLYDMTGVDWMALMCADMFGGDVEEHAKRWQFVQNAGEFCMAIGSLLKLGTDIPKGVSEIMKNDSSLSKWKAFGIYVGGETEKAFNPFSNKIWSKVGEAHGWEKFFKGGKSVTGVFNFGKDILEMTFFNDDHTFFDCGFNFFETLIPKLPGVKEVWKLWSTGAGWGGSIGDLVYST